MRNFFKLIFLSLIIFLLPHQGHSQIGASLRFDGTDDHVQMSSLIVPTSGNFTVEFWVNNTPASGFREFISQGSSGDAFYVGVGVNSEMRCGDAWQTTGVALPSNQWVHVAVVKSGTNGKLFLNGVSVATKSNYTISSSGTNTQLGTQYGGIPEHPNASLDELRIWNIALTQTQIQSTMNCERIATLPSLIANYHFNQGVADGNNTSPLINTLTDYSGNGNNGTLVNFSLTGTSSNWISSAPFVNGTSCETLYYVDADADGYGNSNIDSLSLVSLSGYVTNSLDCDDGNALIFPEATELCNSIDDDCDLAVDDSVEIPKIFTNRSPILCQGESIQLSTVLPGNFAWSNGLINTSLIVVTASGDYVLTNTATNCSSDTLNVLFNTVSATPVITPIGSIEFCEGNFATLSASPAHKYFWSNGDSLSTIKVYTQSTITLTVLDTGSVCISQPSSPVSLTLKLPTPPPTIQNFGPNNLCGGQTTLLNIANGPFPYQSILWNNGSTGTPISVGPGIYSARAVSFNGCISLPSYATVIFEISPAARPVIEFQLGYTNSVCGGGSVGLVASGGSISYLWSNNSFGQFLNASVSGKYSVKGVTNGCFTSPSDSIYVQIFPPHPTPVISSNGPLRVCTLNGLQLTSTPSFKYLWSTGETTQTITVNRGGIYFVRTTDINGCSAQSTSVIVDGVVNGFRDANVLTSGSAVFCHGDSVVLTASTVIGFMENGYLWSNGATTKSIKVYNQGDYSVTVSFNNGCTSPQSGIVPVRVSSTNTAPAIYTSAPLSACQDGIMITLHSTSASNNLWSTGQTTQSINITSGGTFMVTSTNTAGCVSGTSAPLTIVRSLPVVPVISASGPLSFCSGDSVILTSSSPINNLWSNGEVTQSITVRKSGVFSVQYLDSLGCLSATSAPVSVNANPLGTIPSINLIASPVLCAGESAQLLNSSGSAILWNTGATTSSITVNTTGYYKARSTNLFGCASAWSDSIYLYFNPLPSKPVITTNSPVEFCEGGSVRLTPSNGYSYNWSDGDPSKSKLVNVSGAYSVRVVDSLGCISPASDTIFTLRRPLPAKPVLSTEGFVTICGGGPGFSVSSSPAVGYLWSTGETTASVMLPYGGSYSVRAIDAFGCKSEPSNLLNVAVNNGISKPGFQFTSFNVCEGDSILLTSNSPFYNVWSTGDTTRFLYVKTGGNYTLTVNDSANCVAGTSNPFSVTHRPRPDAPVLTPDGPTEFCTGGSVFVSAPFLNTGQNYIWSDGVYTIGPGRFVSVSDTLSVVRIDVSGFGCKSLPSNELNIVVNPIPTAPSITADGPTVFCAGDSVVLTSSVAFGNVWSSGDTTQNAVIKVSNTVNLFLVDENGCQSPSVFQLVLLESPVSPPVINTSGLDTVLCQNESITLTASGGSSSQQVAWNTGVSPFENILSVNSTGSYYAYFVSSNGCVSANSDTVDIIVRSNPAKPVIVSSGPLILNGGNQILCSNDSLVLSTALPAYEYKWEAGGFSVFSADSTFLVVNPPLLAFGGRAYTVTLRDSFGCVSPISDAFVVGGQNSPVASIFLGPNQQAVFCEGGSTIITANVLNQNYLWSNGQTTFSFPVDSSGIYKLTVTDNIGCASAPSAPFTVTEIPGTTTPVITASGKLNYCPGEQINLTLTSSSPTNNSWTNSLSGLNNTFTQSINVNAPGTYTVNTFNSTNCILGSSNIVVTQDPFMPAPVITLLTPGNICPGDSVKLSSNQLVRNSWSTGDTTQVITIQYAEIGLTGSMPIYLNYFNENGCRGLDSALTSVAQIIPDTAKIVVLGSTNFCDGSSVVLMSQSFAANYFWSTGDTSLSITVSDPTTITLQWFNNNVGCSSIISSPVVLNELPNVTWYRDSDVDSFGDPAVTTSNCFLPPGYVSNNTDCNDGNNLINPSATEICNAVDDDCDGTTDEGFTPITYFADSDGDTFGNLSNDTISCSQPSGYVTNSLDCNDGNNLINPASTEICNTLDDDCDGSIDEGLTTTYYRDFDNDTYGSMLDSIQSCSAVAGYVLISGDCNDANAQIHPSATEICNTLDDDCDGTTDEGLPLITYFADSDGDTFGDLSNDTISCTQPSGYVTNSLDCNDGNNLINPASTEICNTLDDDCDGSIDEGLTTTYYRDFDNDTYGSMLDSIQSCSAVAGYVLISGDCNDTNAAIRPNRTELCNSIDDNCNGQIDDGVVIPAIIANSATTFCQGGSVFLYRPTLQPLNWSNGINNNYFTQIFTSGTYYGIDPTTLCQSNSITVTVNPIPNAPTISVSGPTTFCESGSVTLTSSAASNVWSTGQTTQSITVQNTRAYTVRETNAFGCSSASSASVTTTSIPNPKIETLTGSPVSPVCEGTNVQLNASTYVSKAVNFAGSPQYATFGTWFNYQTFTLQMWIRPNSTQTAGSYIVDNNSGSGVNWGIIRTSGNTYAVRINGVTLNTTAFTLVSTAWQHLTVVKSATQIIVYLNGGAVSTSANTTSISYSSPSLILGRPIASATYWRGLIDDFRVWSIARTATEILNDFYKNIITPQSGLAAYYKMEQGTGTNLTDSSGFGRTGSMVSATWTNRDNNSTYAWSPGTYLNNTTILNPLATAVANSITYTITATDPRSGCTGSSTIPYVVNPKPTAPVITASATTICSNASATLQSNYVTGNNWNTQSSQAQSITVSSAGNYWTTFTSASGCTSVNSNIISIAVVTKPQTYTVTASGNNCVFSNSYATVSLSGSQPGVNYQVYEIGGTSVGSIIAGTGSPITFTDQLPTGNYSVVATTAVCTQNMLGQITITNLNATNFYQDLDADGFGNLSVTITDCTKPTGYVIDATDCNDNNASIYPAALELCNGIDDDCNSIIDNVIYPTKPIITANGPTSFCAGASLNLNAQSTTGYAIQFNGSNQEAQLGTWFNYQTFTIEMWVKAGASQVTYADIIDNNHTGARSWVVQQDGNTTNRYQFGINGSPGASVFFDLIPNTWQHLTLVKDASQIIAYINGVNIVSATYAGTVPYDGSQSLRLANWGSGGRTWNGAVDEVRIWNVARTPLQISSNFNNWVASNSPGLIANYHFDEGSGSTIFDASTNGRNASLINNPVWINNGQALLYSWSPSTFLNSSTISNPTATNVTSTTLYNVTVTNAITGCSSSDTISLIANPTPQAPTISANGNTTFCAGGSVTLTSNVPANNLWSNGLLTPNIIASISGNYSVQAGNGSCLSLPSNVISVNVEPNPISYIVTGGGSYCSTPGVGAEVGLSSSEVGVNYQLLLNGTDSIGAPLIGTGSSLSFGLQTAVGVYTVVARLGNCFLSMTGNVSIIITTASNWYQDLDNDGYGTNTNTIVACVQPLNYANNPNDCDDTNPNIHPGNSGYVCGAVGEGGTLTLTAPSGSVFTSIQFASYGLPSGSCGNFVQGGCHAVNSKSIIESVALNQNSFSIVATNGIFGDPCVGSGKALYIQAYYGVGEICNGIDDDCDNAIDENLIFSTYYYDGDADGYGRADSSIVSCLSSPPINFSVSNTDCNDSDITITSPQTWYTDADNDNYGIGISVVQCNRPTNGKLLSELIATSGDCNDNNNLVYPGAQRFEFTGNTNFSNSICNPLVGTAFSTFQFEVDYFDAANALPAGSYPRLILDFEGNGIFTDANDRSYIMTPNDPNDIITSNGKRYIANVSGLPNGSSWKARVVTSDGGSCTATLGPFDAPDVFELSNLVIFANDITFSTTNPNPNDNLAVSAVVHNQSDFDASNFVVHLRSQYDTLQVFPDITIANLAAHSSTTVTWSIITPAVPAWIPMEVKIDFTNVIAESNELDNRAIRPYINGNYNLPGGINVSAGVSPFASYSSPNNYPSLNGNASYFGTAVPLPDPSVAGSRVTFTILETGATYTTYTNSAGYFSYSFNGPLAPGLYHINGEVTDFTLTGYFSTTFVILIPNCLPDLYPSISISPNPVLQGGQISGSITVTNYGCAATTVSTLLDIYQSSGSPLINDVVVPPLGVGQSFTTTLPSVTFNIAGTHTLCATVDATNLVTEVSENNTACIPISVLPILPDIIPVEGPYYSFSSCNSNSFTIRLRNTGGVSTGAFNTSVLVSKSGMVSQLVTQTVANIPPTSDVFVTFPFDFNSNGAGVYSYFVSADIPHPNGVVVESNENNNTATYSNNVVVCKPNLVVSNCEQLDVQPANLTYPGTLTLNATVSNNGNLAATGPIQLRFSYSGGGFYFVTYNGNILPGQSVLFTTSAPVPPHNGQILTANVDPFNAISEFSETDNVGTGSMCWEFQPVRLCSNLTNFWEQTYHLNQPVNLYMAITNGGLYDATNVQIQFEVLEPGGSNYIDLGDAIVPFMSRNCGCPNVGTLNNAYVFPQNGVYTFRVTVDPDNDFFECDESNNVFVVSLTVNDVPDMRILSQYINPTFLNPDIGDSIYFDITYDNIGRANLSDQMELRLLVDNIPLDSIYPVGGLPTGAHATFAIPKFWSSTVPGIHIVRAIIDNDNTITESNELNNEATRAVIVGQSANLFVSSFVPSNSNPALSDTILIATTISNNGDLDCDADVIFYYVNDLLDTLQIASTNVHVNANSSLVMSPFNWYVLDNTTTLIAKIINSSPTEFTYDDNMATTQLGSFLVTTTNTSVTCIGAANGTSTVNVVGGSAPYTYAWSNGYIGQTLTAAAGNYTVTVYDNSGQSVSSTTVISTLLDTTDPVIFNVPATIVYNATDGVCPAPISWIPPSVFENCEIDSFFSSHVPGDLFNSGITSVVYTAKDKAGNISSASFNVQVNGLPLVFAGNDLDACTTVQLNAVSPAWGIGTWSSPTAGVAILNANNNQTTATSMQYTNNVFYWTITNGTCGSKLDSLVVRDTCYCFDLDTDNVCDYLDNCDGTYNPAQLDTDNDGVGDMCDNCVNFYNPTQAINTYYLDFDMDGFGISNDTIQACVLPQGYAPLAGDCNDANDEIYPGASDANCNGIDDNCNGSIDENFDTSNCLTCINGDIVNISPTWYFDQDNDGYGVANPTVISCTQPVGYALNSNDCNDTLPNINPGAIEICGNGIDENCNGSLDDLCPIVLNLKLYIQGYYIGLGQMRTVLKNAGIGNSLINCDSITVELHDAISPTTVVASDRIILLTTGLCTMNVPGGLLGGSYYIVIRHRNSIATWSKLPVSFTSSPLYFDFSTP